MSACSSIMPTFAFCIAHHLDHHLPAAFQRCFFLGATTVNIFPAFSLDSPHVAPGSHRTDVTRSVCASEVGDVSSLVRVFSTRVGAMAVTKGSLQSARFSGTGVWKPHCGRLLLKLASETRLHSFNASPSISVTLSLLAPDPYRWLLWAGHLMSGAGGCLNRVRAHSTDCGRLGTGSFWQRLRLRGADEHGVDAVAWHDHGVCI